jgi:voltage-gated potassium channel
MAVAVDRVARVPVFSSLSDAQLALLADKFEERHVEPGEHLTFEGKGGYFFFVLESGSAEVVRGGDVVYVLHGGEVFGEMAILDTLRRTATITTTAPTTVLAMWGADYAVLTSEIPGLKDAVDRSVAARSTPNAPAD